MELEAQYKTLKTELDAHGTTLVAVSKTYPPERIMELYNLGHRVFGENRVQELLSKKDVLPDDVQWHLIGHLQTNKARAAIDAVSMIESVDSVKLLRMLQKEAGKAERQVEVLLQIKIAAEDTKYGFDPESVIPEMRSAQADDTDRIRFRGVMGMASFVDDPEQIRDEFRLLHSVFSRLKSDIFHGHADFDQISMGMSGDYAIAIEEGSTMVRIGSLLFGTRA